MGITRLHLPLAFRFAEIERFLWKKNKPEWFFESYLTNNTFKKMFLKYQIMKMRLMPF